MAKARTKAQASTKGANAPAPGKRNGLVQQEILEHATRLFALRGYAGTSLQDIADAVGLTRPALYHYVKNKSELLSKLVTEITVVAAVDIGAIARKSDLSATDRIRQVVELLVKRTGESGERFRVLLLSEPDLPGEVAKSYALNRRAILRSLTDIIEQGVSRGEFRPVTPEVAALGTLGIVNWVAWWYHPGSRFDLDAIAVELADMAVLSLAAEQGRTQSITPLDALRSLRLEVDRLQTLLERDSASRPD
jgi:AcrR family transcriptional regulator